MGRIQRISGTNLNPSQTAVDKPNTFLEHRSRISASEAFKSFPPLCSPSAEARELLLGTEQQKGFEPTGESPQPINDNDKRLQNMTYRARLNIGIVWLKQWKSKRQMDSLSHRLLGRGKGKVIFSVCEV